MQEQNTKIDFKSGAFKKYLNNASWLFVERIVRLGITFIIGVYMVRYLGPDNFGILSYAISFVGLFSAIASLGLETIVTRELVKAPEEKDTILGTVFFLRTGGAVIMFLLLGIAALYSNETKDTLQLIFIIAAGTAFQAFNVIDYYFQSLVKSKYSVYALVGSMIVGSVLKVSLIISGAGVLWFCVATALDPVFLAIGFFAVYRFNGLTLFHWRFNKARAVLFMKDAWPLILSGMVVAVYLRIGQVMIKNMLNAKEIGYYASAVRLCEAWYFIPTALTTAIFPSIVNARENELLYHTRLQKLYDILAWIAIGIAVPVTMFSETIITLAFKKEFLPAAPVLTVYIWAGVPVFLGVASSQYLITENLTRMSFYRTLIGMVVNIGLNYLWIPKYGITGSAVATLVSYSFATFSIGTTKQTFPQLVMMVRAMLMLDAFKLLKRFLFKEKASGNT